MFAKLFYRFRRSVAARLEPGPLWSRKTHIAYPELQCSDDGSWVVRFYTYEPYAWMFQGKTFSERPAFPEPTVQHPTTWPVGHAPNDSVVAWNEYYKNSPLGITLKEVLSGKTNSRESAKKAARKVMLKYLDQYRRVS